MSGMFELLYLVVLAVLFSITAVVVARSRGGDEFSAGIIGFLFGPFGVIWSYYLGTDDLRDDRLLKSGRRKLCPDCYELTRPEAAVCKFCNHDFGALQLKPSERPASPASSRR